MITAPERPGLQSRTIFKAVGTGPNQASSLVIANLKDEERDRFLR